MLGYKGPYNGTVNEDNTIFGSRTYKANIASRIIAISHTGRGVDPILEDHGCCLDTDDFNDAPTD